ncbi:MAG: hypothetical protein N2035_03800 [Chthoniobacterales bacterium]|nr:hypothetical protein [Chthoniobacterales bacterium]
MKKYEVFRGMRRSKKKNQAIHLLHRITPVLPTAPSPLVKWSSFPFVLGPINGGLPWPTEYPELRKKEREFLVPLRSFYRWLPYSRSTYQDARAVITGCKHTDSEIPSSFRGIRAIIPENGVAPEKFRIK